MTDQGFGIFASGAQAHRIEVKLDAVLQLLGVERTETHLILQQGHVLMATADDIEADEASLKTAITQLLGITDGLSKALAALKTNPSIPADVQSKLDDLDQKLHADLAQVTAGIAADGQPLNPSDPSQTLSTPFISGVDPASGPAGTVVTLAGRDFTGLEEITVGGVAATTFSAPSDTSASVTVPDGLPAGDAAIIVTNAQGNSNSGTFTVTAAVQTPASAPADGSAPVASVPSGS